MTAALGSPAALRWALRAERYVGDEALCRALLDAVAATRPLLLEGLAGSGKSAAATAFAAVLDLPLVRVHHGEGRRGGLDPLAALLGAPAPAGGVTSGTAFPHAALLLVDDVDQGDRADDAALLDLLDGRAPCIVTTGDARPLPDALVRRCRYHRLPDAPADDRALVELQAPDAAAALGAGGLAALAQLVGALRSDGLAVPAAQVLTYARAAAELPQAQRGWAARLTLAHSRDDLALLESVLVAHGSVATAAPPAAPAEEDRDDGDDRLPTILPSRGRRQLPPAAASSALPPPADDVVAGGSDDATLAHDTATAGAGSARAAAALAARPLALVAPDELAALSATAVAAWRVVLPERATRRRRRARRGRVDLGATVREALRHGGEPRRLIRTARPRRPRRLVLLVDVSGSMAAHTRGALLLAHGALRASPGGQVFAFGTRLTELTRPLQAARAARALPSAGATDAGWQGGTLIGTSLRAFLDRHGQRGVARGAVVALCSDGLEAGPTTALRTELARLRRLAHRVVWLAPQGGELPDPHSHGMRAAAAHVDAFAGADRIEALSPLGPALEAGRRLVGRQPRRR